MKAFSRLVSGGGISGRVFGEKKRMVNMIMSHLIFAYYSMICCYAKAECMRHLRSRLICFEAISSLNINRNKSE